MFFYANGDVDKCDRCTSPGGGCMRIQETMDLYDKLQILTDAAKYDVACTSSGADRKGDGTGMGSCERAGFCHIFSADGRCI